MNKETIKALKESIAHWERLATGKLQPGEDIGPTHCALCARFYSVGRCRTPSPEEEPCPVAVRTGCSYCEDTPYEYALAVDEAVGLDHPDFQAAAQEELDFLRSLLPEKETDQ
jgi:hypothetical protein